MLKTLTLTTFTLGLMATSAIGAPKQFTLDLGHAYVGFEAEHLGYSKTIGEFKKYDGTFMIDEEKPENSKISFTVDVTSLDSNHANRDEHLLNADFFNVSEFKTMTFESSRVEMLSPYHGKLHGNFTMLGMKKPLTLDFKMVKDKNYVDYIPNYDSIRTVGFEVTGTVNRIDHGMDYVGFLGSPVGIGVDVHIQMDLVDCAGMPESNIPCTYGRPGFAQAVKF